MGPQYVVNTYVSCVARQARIGGGWGRQDNGEINQEPVRLHWRIKPSVQSRTLHRRNKVIIPTAVMRDYALHDNTGSGTRTMHHDATLVREFVILGYPFPHIVGTKPEHPKMSRFGLLSKARVPCYLAK